MIYPPEVKAVVGLHDDRVADFKRQLPGIGKKISSAAFEF